MFTDRIKIFLWLVAMSFLGNAQTLTNTEPTLQFRTQLSQQYTNYAWDAGEAYFTVQGGQMHFEVYLNAMFSNFCSAVLYTDSRQVVVHAGPGTLMYFPMGMPVYVPGFDLPVFMGNFGLTAVMQYSGQIPLNETLLRELAAGNGELHFYLPATANTNGYWITPPAVSGQLLMVPGGDATNALASLPRTPRSLSAIFRTGPVAYPFSPNESISTPVDVDKDGITDFGLHGRTLCTMSIPSDCTTMYGLSSASNSQVLIQNRMVLILPMGATIGPSAPTNAAWELGGGDNLTSTTSGSGYRPWFGELGRMGEAYIGFRLRRSDADHYGWMRIRLPKGRQSVAFLPPPGANPQAEPLEFEFGPVIEDWAYEPSPNTAILAGAKPFSAVLTPGGIQRAGYLRLGFASTPGRPYAVQFKPDLSARGWSNVGWLMISTSPETLLDLPISGTQGFYRILEAE